MHGGAVTLARMFMESELQPDLILTTDMLDLTIFLSLTRSRTANIPTAIYFHENQLSYPWSTTDRDVGENATFITDLLITLQRSQLTMSFLIPNTT